eukprot:TRINITY_DN54338_c0_g1_i3.p1 TRINITY_DN54338_c0_g1~~TRINITY_DN54338_c0_g1_i3.p1  ORF type:complete len:584 (-),score=146.59 TRINITY_DN54338_c0_g1_i3:234-1985(-)
MAFVFALMLLTVPGVLSLANAVMGFGNELVFTIGVLYGISRGIQESTLLNYGVKYVLGMPGTLEVALARLVFPVMVLSAFMNNTPLVAMLIPAVQQWSRQIGLPTRQLLMPLSFATILGGMCTQIGTSVNLVVGSLQNGLDGANMGFFEVGFGAVPASILGGIYMCFAARYLLPASRDEPAETDRTRSSVLETMNSQRLFTTGVRVQGLPSISPRGIATAQGMLHLTALNGVPVRSSAADTPVPLHEGDTLRFDGGVEAILELYRMDGVVPLQIEHLERLTASWTKRVIALAVVGVGSSLVGETFGTLRFRSAYGAVVVAIHSKSGGEGDDTDWASHVIGVGDAFLLECDPWFLERHREDADFACVTEVAGGGASILPRDRPLQAVLALSVVMFVIATSSTGILKLGTASMLGCFTLLFCRTMSISQAVGSVSGATLVTIGAGFGLAKALVTTGASSEIAKVIAAAFAGHSPSLLYLGLFLITGLLANVISPVACVNLMFPIAFGIPEARSEAHVEDCLGVLQIAASCSLCTPFSYQTNLMVAEAAGYSVMDFVRFGGPLFCIACTSTVLLATFLVWGPGHLS